MDFITANYMRSGIESAIARGARQSAAASHHVAGRIDAMSREITGGIAHLRTDMLEGMDGVRSEIEALGNHVGQGLYALNVQAKHTHDELRSMGMTLTTLSSNVVTGFNMVLNSLETVQGTLEEIKTGVLNPEETKTLERYRTARMLAEKGRPQEALTYATAAIENAGGLPMSHVPELRALRGMIYMGLHDTPEQSVIDPQKALVELREAIVFARPEAHGMLKDHLGMTLFGIGDYQGALSVYEDLREHRGYAKISDFQKGRCYLSMSMTDHARDVFTEITKADMSMSLVCASDPVCSAHPELFTEIFRDYRRSAVPKIDGAGDRIPDIEKLSEYRNALVKIANTVIHVLGRSDRAMREDPLYKELEQLCAAQPDVAFRIELEVGRNDSFNIHKPLQDLKETCKAFDEAVRPQGLGPSVYNVQPPSADAPWSEITRYATAAVRTVGVLIKAYEIFDELTKKTTDMVQGTGEFADSIKRPLAVVKTNIWITPEAEHRIKNPKKPGMFATMTAEGKRESQAYYAHQLNPSEYEWQASLKIARAAEAATSDVRDALESRIRTRMEAQLAELVPELQTIREFVDNAKRSLNDLDYDLDLFMDAYRFCLKEVAEAPSEENSLGL